MLVGYVRRVSHEKQTPNKVQTDNPTRGICFGGKASFIEGNCSWRDFLCGAAAALSVVQDTPLRSASWTTFFGQARAAQASPLRSEPRTTRDMRKFKNFSRLRRKFPNFACPEKRWGVIALRMISKRLAEMLIGKLPINSMRQIPAKEVP